MSHSWEAGPTNTPGAFTTQPLLPQPHLPLLTRSCRCHWLLAFPAASTSPPSRAHPACTHVLLGSDPCITSHSAFEAPAFHLSVFHLQLAGVFVSVNSTAAFWRGCYLVGKIEKSGGLDNKAMKAGSRGETGSTREGVGRAWGSREHDTH